MRLDNTILLTATINPSVSNTPLTVINDPIIRLNQYLFTVHQLIKSKGFAKIIFCENTNYPADFKKEKELAKKNGVEIEFIKFEGSYSKIEQQGKGYGEGEIISYALENSCLLKTASSFYKLTGRITVSNIYSLVKNSKKSNLFIRYKSGVDSVDTRFFKSDIKFYKEHLMPVYKLVDDFNENYLEVVFYKSLEKESRLSKFSEYPNFIGFSGSTGQSYRMGFLKYWYYNALLCLGKLDVNH